MKRKVNKYHQLNTFSLMNEGLYLLRAGGAEAASFYFVGSLPFMLAFLYFWNDMSHYGYAYERILPGSLFMALAFAWMKTGQTLFCRRLLELRTGVEPTKFTRKYLQNVFINQVTVQPWGILFIPLSMLIVVPFAGVHAFFQNYSILDDGGPQKETRKKALKLAQLWPMQNHLIIWLLSPWLLAVVLVICFGGAGLTLHLAGEGYDWVLSQQGDVPWILLGVLFLVLGIWPACPLALIIALNVGLLIWILPHLLNSFFGIETVFVRSGIYAIANSTVLLTIYAITYLVLDPIMKSTYVLRCFYGDSVATGADLLADLKKTVLLLAATTVVLVTLQSPAIALQPMTHLPDRGSIQELDQAIESTLLQSEYAWQVDHPRKKLSLSFQLFSLDLSFFEPVARWIGSVFRWLGEKIGLFFEWLKKIFHNNDDQKDEEGLNIDMKGVVKPVVYLLAFLLLLFGGWQVIKLYRLKKSLNKAIQSPVVGDVPDLTDEDVSADMLPETQWLDLADRMVAENKPHLALRALYLAGLACLGHWRIIRLEPYKSNREYGNEISRVSSSYPELAHLFSETAGLFEKVWYGDYPVEAKYLSTAGNNHSLIRGCFADSKL